MLLIVLCVFNLWIMGNVSYRNHKIKYDFNGPAYFGGQPENVFYIIYRFKCLELLKITESTD